MLYVNFNARPTVKSDPTAEHNNSRLNTIGLGHEGPTPPAIMPYSTGYPRRRTTSDQYRPFPRLFWNFMELYVWRKSSGTLRNFNGPGATEQLYMK